MAQLTVRTHASAPQTLIPGEGVLIPAAAGSETFTDVARIQRLQGDTSFYALLTDDAYAAGESTLVLVDSGGTDVPQGLAERFLARALNPRPGRVARHSSLSQYVFVGFTDTAGALDTDPNWQIYRYDIRTDTAVYADLDTLYDNVWDDRESLDFLNYYVTTVVPQLGAANIVEGWALTELGTLEGKMGLQNASAGADCTKGVTVDAPQWATALQVARATPGDAIDCGNPVGGEFDFDLSTDSFSAFVWVRSTSTFAGGLLSKQASVGSSGYDITARCDVDPDQVQARVWDSPSVVLANKLDNSASDDAWHLWCFVHDHLAQEWRVHLDKQTPAQNSTAGLSDISNSASLLIGDSVQWGTHPGYYAHAYICSIALSQSQVDALYDGGQ